PVSACCPGGAAAGASPFCFRAEGGIRDFHVPGVQTCALPISCPQSGHTSSSIRAARITGCVTGQCSTVLFTAFIGLASGQSVARSEERRVGQESRGRGSARERRTRPTRAERSESGR